jgi:HK97 family phage major capsid protein
MLHMFVARSIETELCRREFNFAPDTIDKESRTVRLTFSSELPVYRSFGYEVLDHSPGSVDLSRLRDGAPLLLNHNSEDQVGVVEAAVVNENKRGEALVRFSNSPKGQEIFQDVIEGIRRKVSVGYSIEKMVPDGQRDGLEAYRATRWCPLEVTIASVPADNSVGVGKRLAGTKFKTEIDMPSRSLHLDADPAVKPASGGAPPVDLTVIRNQERESEIKEQRDRTREINAIADRIKTDSVRALAKTALESGMKLDEFRCQVLEREYNAKPVNTSAEIGMSRAEIGGYKILSAIRSLAAGKGLEGLEKEAHEAVIKQTRMSPKSHMEFFVPFDIEREQRIYQAGKRALEVGTFTAGGAVVDTILQTGSFIELLRNQMYVMASGARSLTGLVGNIAIPRQTGGATAYWLSETGTTTASQQAVGQLELTPHRLSAMTAYTHQFAAQSSIDAENFVRSDIAQVIALEKDDSAINGSGVSGEPLGIINTTGVNLVTISAAQSITYANSVSFETALALDNSLMGNLAFLATPTVRHNARILPKFSNNDTPVWIGGLVGDVNGYPARATNQCPTTVGACIFGRWDDLIIADWAGMSILVDPYSLSTSGQIRIVVNTLTDNGIRHPESFAVSTT